MPKGNFCKVNVFLPSNGTGKKYEIEDFRKVQQVHGLRIGQEVDGGCINPELAGIVLKISGGNDSQGIAMYQGVLNSLRNRLYLKKGCKFFRERKDHEARRKCVRGCIVSADLHSVNFVIVDLAGKIIPGLTDKNFDKRRVPKIANKLRRLFGIPHNKVPKEQQMLVCKLTRETLGRSITTKKGKTVVRCPKIQRLVTDKKYAVQAAKKATKNATYTANKERLAKYLATRSQTKK